LIAAVRGQKARKAMVSQIKNVLIALAIAIPTKIDEKGS